MEENAKKDKEIEEAILIIISHEIRRFIGLKALDQLDSVQRDLEGKERIDYTQLQTRRIPSTPSEQDAATLKKSAVDTLVALLDKLKSDLVESAERTKDEKGYLAIVQEEFLNAFSYQIQHTFQPYLNYCLIHGLLSSSLNKALNAEYRKELRNSFDLGTSGKLKKGLMPLLDPLFYDEIKHGGSVSEFDAEKRLQFLALYNRYLIVVQNVRKEKRKLKKRKNSDLAAKSQAMAKFEIPENLMISAFSDDTASDVALDWAMETLKIQSGREHSKRLLIEIRRQFRQYGIVIDCDHSIGRSIYSVHPRNNKQHIDQLKYTPLEKTKEVDFGSPGNMLVEYRL